MPQVVVGVPVRNEAAHVGDCLRALALQQGPPHLDIVLLVNNSTDGTADIARALAPALPCAIHVVQHDFPPGRADAGHARRLAMQHAAALAARDGVLMTTDADGRVAPDWLESNLAALAAGADVVCGRAVIDSLDALQIPDHLHADDALECSYGVLLDRIHDLLDPDPADPWPRHAEHSGASIAIRRDVFLAAGGVPAVSLGEDRALIRAVRRIDGRVRHAPEVSVSVSGRIVGRAAGGMADTMRRRIVIQDTMIDDALEPAAACARRASCRRLLREAWEGIGSAEYAAGALGLGSDFVRAVLASRYFGEAWDEAEAASPALRRRPVARAALAQQTARAEAIVASLLAQDMAASGGAALATKTVSPRDG